MRLLLFTRTTTADASVSERIVSELQRLGHSVVAVSTEDDGAVGSVPGAISWRDVVRVKSEAREVDGIVYLGGGGDGSDAWRPNLPGITVDDGTSSGIVGLTTTASVSSIAPAALARRLLDVIAETDINLARRSIAISLGAMLAAWDVHPSATELAELTSALGLFDVVSAAPKA